MGHHPRSHAHVLAGIERRSLSSLDPSLHWRPLALAAIHGREAITHLFVCGYGVDPCPEEGWRSATVFYGGNPLWLATEHGHEAIVQFLLGLPKTSKDYKVGFDRRTLLALAAVEGHLSIVQLLIGRGAQIDPLDELNDTPLKFVSGREQTQRGAMPARLRSLSWSWG